MPTQSGADHSRREPASRRPSAVRPARAGLDRLTLLVVVYAVIDDALCPTSLSASSSRLSSAARTQSGFIEEVRRDDPEVVAKFRIEERELEAAEPATQSRPQEGRGTRTPSTGPADKEAFAAHLRRPLSGGGRTNI